MNTTSGTSDTGCNNLMQNLSVSCWDELDVSGYLAQWWKQNQGHCQSIEFGFAKCYQSSLGMQQQACDLTGPNQCSSPDNFAAGGYSPMEAYALYTIFGIWQWFESIYEAIENADVTVCSSYILYNSTTDTRQAAGPIGAIVRKINPIDNSKNLLAEFMAAFTAFAPVISFPASLGAWGIFKASATIEAILRQSPGVVRELNPVGTLDSEFTDFTQLSEGLAIVKSTYQQNVSNALKMVQDDFVAFDAFARHGSFIAPKSDLQAQTINLTRSLQTFVVSRAFTAANVIITMAHDTDPLALATNGSLGTPNLMNCTAYDQFGLCGEWWYDPKENTAYAVSDIGRPGDSHHDVLEWLFTSGYTNGPDFFQGAKACAEYITKTGGPNTPVLDPTTMVARCISSSQICVYDQSCAINDHNCLYTGEYGGGNDLCKPPREFLTKGCDGNADGTFVTFNVPAAYLGPVSHDGDPAHIDCLG